MSHEYKIEVEAPLGQDCQAEQRQGVTASLIEWGFDPDGTDLVDTNVVQYWGYRSLGGGRTPDEAHAELEAKIPGVVTRWRCVDYDEWDDEFGKKEGTS